MQEQDNNKKNYGFGITMFIVGAIVGSLITAGIYGDEGTQLTDGDDQSATSTLETDTEDDESDTGTDTSSDDSIGNDDEPIVDRSGSDTTDTVESGSENQGVQGELYLDTQDQASGSQVVVSRVTASVPVWIAIRENSNDGMGNILGAKWVPAGDHTDVTVNLLRGTEANSLYFATLYEDNGDKEFDHEVDTLMQTDGQTVYTAFNTTN